MGGGSSKEKEQEPDELRIKGRQHIRDDLRKRLVPKWFDLGVGSWRVFVEFSPSVFSIMDARAIVYEYVAEMNKTSNRYGKLSATVDQTVPDGFLRAGMISMWIKPKVRPTEAEVRAAHGVEM